MSELGLRGTVSEPAAPAFISLGTMIDEHIAILGGGGGRESYADRHIDWADEVVSRRWLMRSIRPGLVDDTLPFATKVAALSRHAPTLVAGAYSNFSRMQHAEAMADAWIVIERYVESLWSDYIADPENKPRPNRRETIAAKLEVLAVGGWIDSDLREHIDLARRHRNALQHGARLHRDAAVEVLDALWHVLKAQCGPVAQPLETRGVSW